jgi:predicted aldo/keto reductase-like oxidoreductase
VDAGVYDVVLTTYNYTQSHKDDIKEAIKYAAEKDVGIIAMKTQGGARLQAQKDITINHKAALKWVINDENVCTTIPGMTTFDQLDLNMQAMAEYKLTEEEKKDLKIIAQLNTRLYCQNCRSCISTCPQHVEIPSLMRAYMYAQGYGNLFQAGETLEELTETQGLKTCQTCLSCVASCKNGLEIASRIHHMRSGSWLV